VAYSPGYLFVGFRCYDSEPDRIRASIRPRDNILSDDLVAIILDTFNDSRRGYFFAVNPYGVQSDGIMPPDGDIQDLSWDAVFESAGMMLNDGWSAEIAIPFKSLRFPDREDQTWGIGFIREIRRKQETDSWPPLSRDVANVFTQLGRWVERRWGS